MRSELIESREGIGLGIKKGTRMYAWSILANQNVRRENLPKILEEEKV